MHQGSRNNLNEQFDISTRTAYWAAGAIAILPWLTTIPTAATRYLGNPACDMNSQFRHFIGFSIRSLWKGQIPQWNPWIFCGTPFLPNTQATLFYPPNWVFLTLLPQPLSINLCIYLHVILFALFTVYYARVLGRSNVSAVFGAGAVSLGSLLVCRIYAGHFTVICTATWIPLAFAMQKQLFTHGQRYVVPFALSMAFMFLGGHAQYAYYAALLLGANLLLEIPRRIKEERGNWFLRQAQWHITAALITILLVAIELMPLIAATLNSARGTGSSIAWRQHFSMPPESYSSVFVPTLFGSGVNYFGRSLWWESCFYIGTIPFVFAIATIVGQIRNRTMSSLSALLLLCIVLGGAGYFATTSALSSLIPGWDLFRGHAKILGFAGIFAAMLAAEQLDTILINRETSTTRVVFLLLLLAAAGLGFWFNLGSQDRWKSVLTSPAIAEGNYMHFDLEDSKTYRVARSEQINAWVLLALWSTLGLLWTWSVSRPSVRNNRLIQFLGLIVLADMLTFTLPVSVQSFSNTESKIPPDIAKKFAKLSPGGRVSIPTYDIMNETMSIPARSFTGHDINISKSFNTYIQAYLGKRDSGPNLQVDVNHESPLLDAANVKYVVTGSGISKVMTGQLKEVEQIGPAIVWERTTALPRAFVVGSFQLMPGDGEEQIFDALSKGWDMKHEVLLAGFKPTGNSNQMKFDAQPAEVRDISSAEIGVKSPQAGWLVLAESFYPGWIATISGKSSRIYRANGAFRAVQVNAGDEVIFRYTNTSFLIGAVISVLTATSLMIVGNARRTRRSNTA